MIWKPELLNPLVNTSASWSCVDTYGVQISPLSIFSFGQVSINLDVLCSTVLKWIVSYADWAITLNLQII